MKIEAANKLQKWKYLQEITKFCVATRAVHIMLRDLLTEKCEHKKKLLILNTPEHVDSENIKLKIGSRSLLYQLFSKRDFLLIKCGKNWQKFSIFQNLLLPRGTLC
jgi:hypothetical protein